MEPRKLTREDIDKVRHIDGFPIAKDEDIIALSNAPYYTACPNPFVGDFIKEYGKAYDEEKDDYHREPFAADVSEGKSDDIYNIHTYHTKVPPKAILKYILHYTNPGDVIYDAFSGSGMTGVACAMASKSNFVNEAGDFTAVNGVRNCILSDLSVAASYISQGYNYPGKIDTAIEYANQALEWLREDFGWAYKTRHIEKNTLLSSNVSYGEINYVVWSDVLICPHCGEEIIYYFVGIDEETGHKKGKSISCKSCSFEGKTQEFEKAITKSLNRKTGDIEETVKEVPVLINYSYGKKKYEKEPDDYDLDVIGKINEMDVSDFYPSNEIPDGHNTNQPKNSHLVSRIDKFYTKRSLLAYSKIWGYVDRLPNEYQNILKFWLQSVSVGFTKMNRYFSSSFSQVNRYLKGTLYIASVRSEVSPWYALKGKVTKIGKVIANPRCLVTCMSSEKSLIPNDAIDYIFIDPPFGSNIMYSDLNIIWESWLKARTSIENEAIINEKASKNELFYKEIMEKVLQDCYRVLKPNRWITVEFHNSQNKVWNILQSAITKAGFIIADVRVLDKKVQTMKQYSTQNSVDKDLVISAYKPKTSFKNEFINNAGTIETAWSFINQHLDNLPVVVTKNGKIELIAERQPYLLFDRMVAYHIMNGIAVPIDATDFYSGLDEKYLKRDGMYFLPDQVNEYDTARIINDVEPMQFELFVTNEKSAIAWLYQQLENPQTYAELQPKFMQEIKAWDKFEERPELNTLLEENFLQNEDGKWYVPDVTKAADVIKLREKKLLKEFEGYLTSKGKLKLFRAEAVRVGFAKLWTDKNYKLIVETADRLPESVIQEDDKLLMYYDISLGRI